MFETLFTRPHTLERHRTAPYADFRRCFLRQCSEQGYSISSLRRIAWILLIISQSIDLSRSDRISRQDIEFAVDHRIRLYKRPNRVAESKKSRMFLIRVATEWFRFLGVLEESQRKQKPFEHYVESFIHFMRDERGLASATISFRENQVIQFLAHIQNTLDSLSEISIRDVDAYIAYQGCHGWSRRSLHTLVDALRNFFSYTESKKWTRSGIAAAINAPRIYSQEGIPLGPTWDEVKQIVASFSPERAADIRDRAIVLLLAVYGLRSGEVSKLCLEDIDWIGETLHVTRPKQRCTQLYPLDRQVGDAIVHYLKKVRPQCSYRQLFLTINAPVRPLGSKSIAPIVRSRLDALGIKLPRRGAHCLRHACARHLLDAGFSLKQIGDQLGHRSTEATREYVKVDLVGLRQVAEINLEDLL